MGIFIHVFCSLYLKTVLNFRQSQSVVKASYLCRMSSFGGYYLQSTYVKWSNKNVIQKKNCKLQEKSSCIWIVILFLEFVVVSALHKKGVIYVRFFYCGKNWREKHIKNNTDFFIKNAMLRLLYASQSVRPFVCPAVCFWDFCVTFDTLCWTCGFFLWFRQWQS